MILKLMGLADIFIAANLFALSYGLGTQKLILISAAYLIIKGLIFLKDFVSMLEVVIGVVMIIGLFVTVPKVLLIVFGLLVLQKGIFSLFA